MVTKANPKGLNLLGHNLCKFNEKGHEILDTTPVEMPDQGFEPTSSADEKMRLMLEAMQEKLNRMAAGKPAYEYETVEASHDFDVPDEGFKNPFAYDPNTKQLINEAKRESQLRKKQKQTAGENPASRKSAATDRAERVELDKDSKSSASKAPTEGADD